VPSGDAAVLVAAKGDERGRAVFSTEFMPSASGGVRVARDVRQCEATTDAFHRQSLLKVYIIKLLITNPIFLQPHPTKMITSRMKRQIERVVESLLWKSLMLFDHLAE